MVVLMGDRSSPPDLEDVESSGRYYGNIADRLRKMSSRAVA
jgi:hypothetical protein